MIFKSLIKQRNLLHITASAKKKPPKWLAKFLTKSTDETNEFVIDVDALNDEKQKSSVLALVRKYYIAQHQILICNKLIEEYKQKDPNAKISMAKVFGIANGAKVLQLQLLNNLLPNSLEKELGIKAKIPHFNANAAALNDIKSGVQTLFDDMKFFHLQIADEKDLHVLNTHLKAGDRYVIDKDKIVELPECEPTKKGYYKLHQYDADAGYLSGLPPTKYALFEGQIVKIYTTQKNKQVLVTCTVL